MHQEQLELHRETSTRLQRSLDAQGKKAEQGETMDINGQEDAENGQNEIDGKAPERELQRKTSSQVEQDQTKNITTDVEDLVEVDEGKVDEQLMGGVEERHREVQ